MKKSCQQSKTDGRNIQKKNLNYELIVSDQNQQGACEAETCFLISFQDIYLLVNSVDKTHVSCYDIWPNDSFLTFNQP